MTNEDLNSLLTYKFPDEIRQLSDKVLDHESLYKFSIDNDELFWGTLARHRLEWFQDFEQIKSGNFDDPLFRLKWFIGGKLNVSVNCVDRHFRKDPNKIALNWEKDEPGCQEYVTYE